MRRLLAAPAALAIIAVSALVTLLHGSVIAKESYLNDEDLVRCYKVFNAVEIIDGLLAKTNKPNVPRMNRGLVALAHNSVVLIMNEMVRRHGLQWDSEFSDYVQERAAEFTVEGGDLAAASMNVRAVHCRDEVIAPLAGYERRLHE